MCLHRHQGDPRDTEGPLKLIATHEESVFSLVESSQVQHKDFAEQKEGVQDSEDHVVTAGSRLPERNVLKEELERITLTAGGMCRRARPTV